MQQSIPSVTLEGNVSCHTTAREAEQGHGGCTRQEGLLCLVSVRQGWRKASKYLWDTNSGGLKESRYSQETQQKQGRTSLHCMGCGLYPGEREGPRQHYQPWRNEVINTAKSEVSRELGLNGYGQSQ